MGIVNILLGECGLMSFLQRRVCTLVKILIIMDDPLLNEFVNDAGLEWGGASGQIGY